MVRYKKKNTFKQYRYKHVFYLEEFAECDVIEAVGAVEHDTLLRHGLRQILRRLRLSGSGRALRSATWWADQINKCYLCYLSRISKRSATESSRLTGVSPIQHF